MLTDQKKVSFHTLGCKLNFAETSSIARIFTDNGFEKVEFGQPSDICVINTCSVTSNADRECKDIVKSALKVSPNAFVAIIGCYAQLKPHEIGMIEGVDLVLGANEKFKIIDYISDITKRTKADVFSCEIEQADFFVDAYSFGDRTRAFLKVQDGCDYNCSFCTIPLARGKSRSDTIENAVKNANEIATKGVKEIVLTGVNLGDFGKINKETKKHDNTFLDLIKALDEVEGIERIRISSIEPNLLKDEVIDFVSRSKRFVPHFHIPLQSGSDKILKLMRRRYLSELYAGRVQKIKSLMPDCSIGVDVIVGFPGETEEDFIETYEFLQSLDISYLHVFTYSERNNTDAINLKGAVPMNIRKQRNTMLRTLSAKKQRAFYEKGIGKTKTVLFESESKNGFITGFTENYIKVKAPFEDALVNTLHEVELTEIDTNGLFNSHPATLNYQTLNFKL